MNKLISILQLLQYVRIKKSHIVTESVKLILFKFKEKYVYITIDSSKISDKLYTKWSKLITKNFKGDAIKHTPLDKDVVVWAIKNNLKLAKIENKDLFFTKKDIPASSTLEDLYEDSIEKEDLIKFVKTKTTVTFFKGAEIINTKLSEDLLLVVENFTRMYYPVKRDNNLLSYPDLYIYSICKDITSNQDSTLTVEDCRTILNSAKKTVKDLELTDEESIVDTYNVELLATCEKIMRRHDQLISGEILPNERTIVSEYGEAVLYIYQYLSTHPNLKWATKDELTLLEDLINSGTPQAVRNLDDYVDVSTTVSTLDLERLERNIEVIFTNNYKISGLFIIGEKVQKRLIDILTNLKDKINRRVRVKKEVTQWAYLNFNVNQYHYTDTQAKALLTKLKQHKTSKVDIVYNYINDNNTMYANKIVVTATLSYNGFKYSTSSWTNDVIDVTSKSLRTKVLNKLNDIIVEQIAKDLGYE